MKNKTNPEKELLKRDLKMCHKITGYSYKKIKELLLSGLTYSEIITKLPFHVLRDRKCFLFTKNKDYKENNLSKYNTY